MFGLKQSLLIGVGVVLLLHSSLQFSPFRAAKGVKCPATPRPVNKSIKAAWDYTKKLETTLLTKTSVKTNICLSLLNDNVHKLGVEIMHTSKTIYCFGLYKGKDFAVEDFIGPISDLMQVRSEIMDDPDICVVDGDYKDLDCLNDIGDLNDYNIMYRAVMEQARLLETLFIRSHKDY